MSISVLIIIFLSLLSLVCLFGAFTGIRHDPRQLRCSLFLLLGLFSSSALLGFIAAGTNSPVLLPLVLAIFLTIIFLFILVTVFLPITLFINGLIVLKREGIRSVPGLLVFLSGIALSVGMSLISKLNNLHKTWAQILSAFLTSITLYLGLFLVVLLLQFIVRRCFGGRRRVPDPHAIIVLGSGLVHGRVTPLLSSRLDKALKINAEEAAEGRSPVLVVSGGKGTDEPRAEAEAMSEYFVERGVEPDRIIVEDMSRTTRENLLFSTALLSKHGIDGPALVVTNSFHTTRTDVLAADMKLNDVFVTGSPTAKFYAPGAFLREYVGVLTYRIPLSIGVGVFCVALSIAMPWITRWFDSLSA